MRYSLSSNKNIRICVKDKSIRINGIFMKDSSFLDLHDFIELKVIDEPLERTLYLYKLVGIVFDKFYPNPSIDLIINLINFKTDKNDSFTVGGRAVPEALITYMSEEVGKKGFIIFNSVKYSLRKVLPSA